MANKSDGSPQPLGVGGVTGKIYRLKREKLEVVDHKIHGDALLFVPVDEEKIKNDIEFIIDHMEEILDKREILREVLNNMEMDRLRKIRNLIKRGAKIRKTSGCLGVTVGDDSSGEYIQIA